ncbi:MAG TPA: hypothetical protein VFD59_16135 [Nocardioidaceae bacterium]|nr:hypothetical protein [Nocardioidaceae bacterium]
MLAFDLTDAHDGATRLRAMTYAAIRSRALTSALTKMLASSAGR